MNSASDGMLTLLEQDIMRATDLLQVLLREYAVLGRWGTDGLDEVTREKEARLVELQETARERDDILRRAGLPPTRIGMERFVAQCMPLTPRLSEAWAQLKNLLAQLQRQNVINGQVVQSSRRHTEWLLGVMRGQDTAVELYGPSATSSVALSPRPIAKA